MKMTLDSRLSPPVAKQLKGGDRARKHADMVKPTLSQERDADEALRTKQHFVKSLLNFQFMNVLS